MNNPQGGKPKFFLERKMEMNLNLELSYHQMKEEQNLIDFEQFQHATTNN